MVCIKQGVRACSTSLQVGQWHHQPPHAVIPAQAGIQLWSLSTKRRIVRRSVPPRFPLCRHGEQGSRGLSTPPCPNSPLNTPNSVPNPARPVPRSPRAVRRSWRCCQPRLAWARGCFHSSRPRPRFKRHIGNNSTWADFIERREHSAIIGQNIQILG